MKGIHALLGGFILLSGVSIFWNLGRADKPAVPPLDSLRSLGENGKGPLGENGKGSLEILFSTSDGKKEWVEEVTKDFNKRGVKVADGRVAKVKLLHMRSGESIQKILA